MEHKTEALKLYGKQVVIILSPSTLQFWISNNVGCIKALLFLPHQAHLRVEIKTQTHEAFRVLWEALDMVRPAPFHK